MAARTALERAIAALAAHPERSNRAAAAEIGVSYQTVNRARDHIRKGKDVSVDVSPIGVSRIGRDGRRREVPPPLAHDDGDPTQAARFLQIKLRRLDTSQRNRDTRTIISDEVQISQREVALLDRALAALIDIWARQQEQRRTILDKWNGRAMSTARTSNARAVAGPPDALT